MVRSIEIETIYSLWSYRLVWFRLVGVVRVQDHRFDDRECTRALVAQYTGLEAKFETGMRLLAYHTDMAAALPRFRGCPCTNPDEKQFPAIYYVPFRGEFELPTVGDVECCFHTPDRSRSRGS